MDMKRKIIIITFVFVVLTRVYASNNEIFEMTNFLVKNGNSYLEFQEPIFTHNSRIYVPLRELCEKFNVPIQWDEVKEIAIMDTKSKKVDVSDKTEYKEEGIIPDEETALAIGKIVLEKYAGKPMEYEVDNKKYILKANYFKEQNCWYVFQTFLIQDGGWNGSGFYTPSVTLNKNTGEVISINTYSSFGD